MLGGVSPSAWIAPPAFHFIVFVGGDFQTNAAKIDDTVAQQSRLRPGRRHAGLVPRALVAWANWNAAAYQTDIRGAQPGRKADRGRA